MQIKVIKTTTASQYPCGTKLFVYEAGNTYDIYEDLAKVFLKEGWGKKEDDNKVETQDLADDKVETQDLKLETKPKKNANK